MPASTFAVLLPAVTETAAVVPVASTKLFGKVPELPTDEKIFPVCEAKATL